PEVGSRSFDGFHPGISVSGLPPLGRGRSLAQQRVRSLGGLLRAARRGSASEGAGNWARSALLRAGASLHRERSLPAARAPPPFSAPPVENHSFFSDRRLVSGGEVRPLWRDWGVQGSL